MGRADSNVESARLFHLRRDNHGVKLFEILLLLVDFHHSAGWNVHRPEHLVGAEVGYQWRCHGQSGLLSDLFHSARGLHQMENRGAAHVEEVVACGRRHLGFVPAQLAVDECFDAFAAKALRKTYLWLGP